MAKLYDFYDSSGGFLSLIKDVPKLAHESQGFILEDPTDGHMQLFSVYLLLSL